jgi:hypothetical protein
VLLQTVAFSLKERYQRGHVFEASSNAFHVRYHVNEIVNGEPKRVQRSQRLCGEDRSTGRDSKTANAVRQLAEDQRAYRQHRSGLHHGGYARG